MGEPASTMGAADREKSSEPADATLRIDIETDAKAAWKGEAFLSREEVVESVTAITLTHAWRCSHYVRGSCEIAALLLYVMACGDAVELADAEADAFWCLSQIMAEVQDSIVADSSLAGQVRRTHELLRAYDPALAELLAEHGLGPMPALRLGAALFTRSGFKLADCVRIWDTLLADPHRFDFCDFVIVALVLLTRGDLLQHSELGSIAETLLAAPREADVDALLRTAFAVCAFERRPVMANGTPFPPRPARGGPEVLAGGDLAPGALDAAAAAAAAAQTRLSSLWKTFRAVGTEAWEVGRNAARDTAEKAPAWGAHARAALDTASSTLASTAASAAQTAATTASAALERLDQHVGYVEPAHTSESQNAGEDAAGDEATSPTQADVADIKRKQPLDQDAVLPAQEQAAPAQEETVKAPPELIEAPALVEAPKAEEEHKGAPQLVQLPG